MPRREELHALVDQLSEQEAGSALRYLRQVTRQADDQPRSATERLAQRMGPVTAPAAAFAVAPGATLAMLAAQQDVSPVRRFEELLGTAWPAEEALDDFLVTLRRWRRADVAGDGASR